MRIAIPTTDRISLFNRTGRAKEFAIYDVENGTCDFVEFRENPHSNHDHDDDHHHAHDDVVGSLKDCDALLVKTAGQHFRKDFDKADIPLYQTKQTQLSEIINVFAKDMLRHKRL